MQLCSLPVSGVPPTQSPRWPGANRRKTFRGIIFAASQILAPFCGSEQTSHQLPVFSGISCINQMARRAGSGFLHTYRTQLSQNSRPKHITQTPQSENGDLARCAQFLAKVTGKWSPGPVLQSWASLRGFRMSGGVGEHQFEDPMGGEDKSSLLVGFQKSPF